VFTRDCDEKYGIKTSPKLSCTVSSTKISISNILYCTSSDDRFLCTTAQHRTTLHGTVILYTALCCFTRRHVHTVTNIRTLCRSRQYSTLQNSILPSQAHLTAFLITLPVHSLLGESFIEKHKHLRGSRMAGPIYDIRAGLLERIE